MIPLANDIDGTPVALYLAIKPYLLALLITLPRIAAFLSASQLLPASAAPRLARQGVTLVLAATACPVNLGVVDEIPDESLVLFAGLFLKEWVIGFMLGYAVAWIFWSIQSAGGLIDNQRGAAIAASIDPLQGHESTPLGNIFSQAFIAYFLASGGFLLVYGLLLRSYEVWSPVDLLPVPGIALAETSLEILDLGMRIMFLVAGPVLVVMFIAEFALALVSRFAPQIQVFILAMPIKSGIAIFMLVFYFDSMFRYMQGQIGLLDNYFDAFYAIFAGDRPLE
jgi:type III secretion protein T